MLNIYIDADACPVKDEVYRVAERHKLIVKVVSNTWMRVPRDARIELVVVDDGFDAADNWIVANAGAGDIVVSNDIPLAARCIDGGVQVIKPTGHRFTGENIGDALASRNLLDQLRGAGAIAGGPPPFSKKDRSRFLQALEQVIQEVKRS